MATRVGQSAREQDGGVARASTAETDLGILFRGAVEVDFEEGRSALKRCAAQLSNLIRGIENPGAKPPRLKWTNAEVATHLIQTFRYDLANVEGTSTPYPVEGGNVLASGARASEVRIKEETERDPRRLADMFDEAVKDFLDRTADRDPLQPVVFAEGHAMTLANLNATILGEVLVHGFDIAKGDGKSWKMDPEASRLAVYATTATLPLGVDQEAAKDIDVRLNVRLRGGRAFQMHLFNGTGTTEPCSKADATISADAAAFMLVGFGRIGPVVPVLTGKIIAWGRRPLLAARMNKYLLPI